MSATASTAMFSVVTLIKIDRYNKINLALFFKELVGSVCDDGLIKQSNFLNTVNDRVLREYNHVFYRKLNRICCCV